MHASTRSMTEIVTDEPVDLTDELLACSNDPLRFVELAFPGITPERWQRQVMTHIGDQLSTNAQLSKFNPIQVAVASGNTIGKTALLSWLILWSLTTFEDCLGVVTAGTEPQIRTRLWGELRQMVSSASRGVARGVRVDRDGDFQPPTRAHMAH